MKRFYKQSGFTIVELLIVIVVIGILAAITIVAYNGIQNRANIANVQAALSQVVARLESYSVENNSTYPSALSAAGINNTPGTTYTYVTNSATTPPSYCVTATTNGVSYYVDRSTGTTPVAGPCPPPTTVADSFTGTDGSAWPSTWTPNTSGTANTSVDLLGNTGRVQVRTAANSWAMALRNDVGPATNQGILVTISISPVATFTNGTIYITFDATTVTNYTPLYGTGVVITSADAVTTGINTYKYVNGTNTSMNYYSMAGIGLTNFKVRLERLGTTTRYKIWDVNAAEPASWTTSLTDSTVYPAGSPLLAVRSTSSLGLIASFDDLLIYVP